MDAEKKEVVVEEFNANNQELDIQVRSKKEGDDEFSEVEVSDWGWDNGGGTLRIQFEKNGELFYVAVNL